MKESETYRRAARVVAAMDPRMRMLGQAASSQAQNQNEMVQGFGLSYSQTEAAIWSGYAGAAATLRMIADEIERGEKSTP